MAMPLSAAQRIASRPAMSGFSGFVGGFRPVAVFQVASSALVAARPAISADPEPTAFHARFPLAFFLADFLAVGGGWLDDSDVRADLAATTAPHAFGSAPPDGAPVCRISVSHDPPPDVLREHVGSSGRHKPVRCRVDGVVEGDLDRPGTVGPYDEVGASICLDAEHETGRLSIE